ncbi:DNA polymerase I [Gammaproteobacteria bacterium]|nr:DNA polymerase I [Gammaproteobacteria bacterium]
MTTSKQLILVDGSSYLFRAFHALPPLVNSKQQPTGAVKGVINMIRSLIKGHPDSNVAIVFDAKGKTFRSDLYSEYKATRPPMPDELRSQIEPIHQIVQAMGLPMLVIPGVEADDVIGTLSKQATAQGIKTLISTGDKDLAQLVDEHVTLMNTMNNERLDVAGVVAKFGIAPNQIIDFLALTGDKADNIPGVPGVGPKTAVKWLLEHQSMDGVIQNADAIGGKIGERLRENIDLLRLSYELATIKLDCELDLTIDELVPSAEDGEVLLSLFSELEFKSWVKELESQGIKGASTANAKQPINASADSETIASTTTTHTALNVTPKEIQYSLVDTEEKLQTLLSKIEASSRFSISLETQGEHFFDTEIIGVAISTALGISYYIPLGHVNSEEGELVSDPWQQLDKDHALELLKPYLEDRLRIKAGHDLKATAHVLANRGIDLQPIKADVHLASYVLNSVTSRHALEDIARHYLDLDQSPIELESLTGKGRGKLTKKAIAPAAMLDYAAQRADLILRASLYLEHELAADSRLEGIYRLFELPLVNVLRTMEQNGITLDRVALARQSDELGTQLNKLELEAHALAGEAFNLGSPKQLQAILYEKLELPMLKKTKTGQPSTAEPVLAELAQDYELPRVILEQRSLAKLKSTYTDKLPLQVNANTGRIHSTFQQAVAATGRLSSTDPNLQNIPIRTAEGRRVRQAFVSAPDMLLLAADYSQVELRIMAHLSQDPGLLKAFSSAQDVHRATASDVFGVALDEVTSDQRRSAKAINFGLIYGMSAFGLANQIGVSRGEAGEYIERYFEKYPGVRTYMDETQALADEKGYVETLFGRRLYLPDIHAGNGMLRNAAQRTAINAPMQGTAADIIKRAMIDIQNWLNEGSVDARMLLQVHDELVFEVSERDLPLLADGVRFRMVSAAALDVPLVVDIGTGKNWDEAH